MDEQTQCEDGKLPLQGPHWHRNPSRDVPQDFFPLRMILQPSGYNIELNKPELVLGRHSEADLRLPLPDVSRRHCRLSFLDGTWQLFDLNSLNGTFVNGQRTQHAVLQHRDMIRMGGFFFEVQYPADHPAINPTVDSILYRIAESLPPEQDPRVRRAS